MIVNKCGLKINGVHDRFVEKGDVIYIPKNVTHEFYIEPNYTFFDPNTENLSDVANNTKWAFIISSIYQAEIDKFKNNEKITGYTNENWGSFENTQNENFLDLLGIGYNYKRGEFIRFTYLDESRKFNSWKGEDFIVLNINEKDILNSFYFYVVFYSEPSINIAYFKIPKVEVQNTTFNPETNLKEDKITKEDKSFFYGESVELVIKFHRFCNSKIDQYSFFIKCNIQFYLTDGVNGELISDTIFKHIDLIHVDYSSKFENPNSGYLNTIIRLNIDINESWKKYHPEITNKKYSIHIVALEINYFHQKEHSEYNIKKEDKVLLVSNIDSDHLSTYHISNFFSVRKSAFEISLFNEHEKKNMIQYIGDVPYTNKQNEPCAFSIITVSDGERKVEIFNEYKLVDEKIKDSTSQYFDIIAGENKKKITVTAKFKENNDSDLDPIRLADKNSCLKILNDNKEHKTHKDVFKMEYIIGQYIKKNDPDFFIKLYKDQLKPIEITDSEDTYKKQRDIKSLTNINNFEKGETYPEDSVFDKYKNLTVAQIQGLTSNDYKIDPTTDSITLDLGYKYDKSIAEGTPYQNKLLDNFWLFKYFWLSNDLAQIYFVPVTTCRYPNQLAKIKIYPDMAWEIAFTFALENPLAYTHSNLRSGNIFKEAQDKARKSGYDRYALSKGRAVPAEFSLSVLNKRDKKSDGEYSIKDEYALVFSKKIADFFEVLSVIKNLADNVKNSAGGKVKNATPDLPFSFEVMSPKLGVKVSWEGELIEDNYSTTGLLSFVADPLVGAELTIDMLDAVSNVHPVVKALEKGLSIGLEALGGYMKLDAVFYGQLNITIEALKFNTKKGISTSEKPVVIEGKMGVKLVFTLKVSGELKAPIFDYILDFEAEAKFEGNAYFGGTALINVDKKGIYADITGKFSGLIFSAVIEIKIGRYMRKHEFESEPIFESEEIPLGKKYLVYNK